MDLITVVQHTVENLAPALPFLVDVGHGAAKKIGENAVSKSTELARSLWEIIYSKASVQQPTLIEGAKDVAIDHEDRDAQGALRLQLRKLLSSNPDLQHELQNILESKTIQSHITSASGAGSIAVGGNVSGSSLTTSVNDQPL